MAKIDKIINIKVEGVRRIKELEENLKKLRKQQRDNNKQSKSDAESYSKNSKAIKEQSKELRDLKKAMSGANDAARKSNKLQKSMTMGVIKGAAAFTILLTAFRRVNQALTTIIGTFTEFEFVMAKVKAVSGATPEEFKRLTQAAEDLGRSTFFTATEVGNLQLNLSKLGFTVKEIEQATQGVINLSIATGSDLARSATVAGNAIRGFQLDASETTKVVDIMAVAFTSSALDIEKWQTSMTKVAPIAAMAGFSIEETTAIMAKLADTGIEASIAGTSLRNILLKMQDPTSDLTKKVGHTITNLDDMLSYFKQLQDEGTDLGDVLTFMDVRQVAAFGTMLEGADDIKTLVEELENADGAGQRMADTVGDTLQGSIFRVKSALQGVSIALVKQFGPSMQRTLEKFARWLNRLVSSEEKLDKFWKTIKTATKTLAAFAIGLPIVRRAMKFYAAETAVATTVTNGLTTATIAAKFAMRGLKVAIASTGIGLLVIGLGELVTGLIFAETEQERLNGLMDDQGRIIVDIIDKKRILADMETHVADSTTKEIIQIDRLTKAYKDSETPMEQRVKILNKLKKISAEHFGELREGISDYDDLSKASEAYKKSIIELAKIKAAESTIVDLEKQLIELKFQEKQNMQDIKDYGEFLRHMWQHEDWWGGAFGHFTMSEARKRAKRVLREGQQTRIPGDPYNLQYPYELMMEGEAAYDKIKLFRDEINQAQKLSRELEKRLEGMDLSKYLDLDDGPDDCPAGYRWSSSAGKCVKISTSAKYTMSEMVQQEESRVGTVDDELEYNILMLEARGRGIKAFQNQDKITKEEATKASIAYNKNILALNKARYAKELRDLIDAKEAEKLALQADDEFKLLSKEEQNIKLLDIDAKFEADKKVAAEKHEQETQDIENRIAQQELERAKLEVDAKVALLDEQYANDLIALEQVLADKEITEMEHHQFMLQLEAAYLLQKHELYAGYGEEQKKINNELKKNTVETTKAQMDAMDDYLSSIGDLGQQMQDLAGDEEKLSGLRKAGVVITKAAATAEKILSIATTINTLATKKKTLAEVIDVSMTGKVIAANVAKTISNISTAASGFIATVSSAAKSIPFPFNLAAIAATYLAIRGVVRSIRSTFSSSGSDGLPSESGGSSSGGSSGGGGMMSLMTFGGRHTTVGQVDSYASGGMVHGKSHAQGGEKFAVGGRVVELEGGEAVINKRSTAMFRSQLSAMNYAGGGVKFADGGVTNIPSFSQTQFQVDGQKQLSGVAAQRSKVVVVEADITQSQNTVSAIEAEAAF